MIESVKRERKRRERAKRERTKIEERGGAKVGAACDWVRSERVTADVCFAETESTETQPNNNNLHIKTGKKKVKSLSERVGRERRASWPGWQRG